MNEADRIVDDADSNVEEGHYPYADAKRELDAIAIAQALHAENAKLREVLEAGVRAFDTALPYIARVVDRDRGNDLTADNDYEIVAAARRTARALLEASDES